MRRTKRSQRGIALLLVLIAAVLLITLALEIAQTSATQGRLGRNAMNDFLLRTASEGRLHILRASLRYDATSGDSKDTEADDWAWFNREQLSSWGERSGSGLPQDGEDNVTFRNTDVRIVAYCEDERSKLNLLGLSRPEDSADFTITGQALIRLIDEFRDHVSALDLSESDGQEMVDDLVEWLQDQGEEDDNPIPPVAAGRGKLQSVDDLLRVPGGKWKASVLFDVLDPDRDPEETTDDAEGGDGEFERVNGVPGLLRYLTVHAESGANPPLRINVNTAPRAVLRALFDDHDRELADAIVEHRREGAGEEESAAPAEGDEVGFFANKSQLSRVEGMAESLDVYPRLNYFADVRSDVYSLRVVATMVTGTIEGEWDAEDEDADEPRDIVASYQVREIVQRVEDGFVTLFRERRSDPILER